MAMLLNLKDSVILATYLKLNKIKVDKGEFKYLGYTSNKYSFINKTGKQIAFSKCRKDLIDNYKLNQSDYINEWFVISYFKTKPLNPADLDTDVFIISDMNILV